VSAFGPGAEQADFAQLHSPGTLRQMPSNFSRNGLTNPALCKASINSVCVGTCFTMRRDAGEGGHAGERPIAGHAVDRDGAAGAQDAEDLAQELRLDRGVHAGVEGPFEMHLVEAAVGEIEPGGDRIGQRMGPDFRLRLFPGLRVGGIVEAGVVEIFVEDVEFPEMLVGIGDPEFGLQGVAAFDPFLPLRGDAPFLQPALQIDQRDLIGQPKAEMIQRAVRPCAPVLASASTRAAASRFRSAPTSASPVTGSLFSSRR
jgi:hypothetical protein